MNITIEDDLSEKTKKWLLAVITHDFTKRQLKIVGFIYLFCIHNKNLECHIPHLNDFEKSGVAKTKIKHELEKLVEHKIIEWNRVDMTFKINTDTSTWKIKDLKKTDARIEQIFELNSQILTRINE